MHLVPKFSASDRRGPETALMTHSGLRLCGATGFDFPAYRFGAAVLKLAEMTIEKFGEQATRLYEQGRRERRKAPLLGRYVRRWLGWATGGLAEYEAAGAHQGDGLSTSPRWPSP
jgi:hypothetical protein